MKKILVLTTLAAIIGLGAVTFVSAGMPDGNGLHSVIIQKLAERFSLNEEDVQEVFDEVHEEMQQEMESRSQERAGEFGCLSELTDEQKELLSAKREEMREGFEALKDLSCEERQARMEELKAEMEEWAELNGIDINCLGMLGKGFDKRGFGRGFGPMEFDPEISE